MTITWNPILRARAGEPVLRNLAASGGRSPTGREQRVTWDAGFWHVPLTGLVVNTREKAAAYRAMLARLRQGEDIIFPLCQRYLAPGARDIGASVTVADASALRATKINLLATGLTIAPGYYFSLGGDRLHLITEIYAGPGEDPDSSPWLPAPASPWADDPSSPWLGSGRPDASWAVKIIPPLRAAVSGGAAANFKDLRLRCVLQDLSDGDLDLDLGRFGSPSLPFIESF